MIDLASFTASDYAAWWGAIIASLALIWNIVVFIRSGARVKIYVTPNMELYPPNIGEEDHTFIFVKAVNKGNSATTITHFCGYTALNHFDRLRNKIKPFMIGSGGNFKRLPVKLEPGEEWVGLALQDGDLLEEKLLYLGIYHNQNDKPIYKKVKIAS